MGAVEKGDVPEGGKSKRESEERREFEAGRKEIYWIRPLIPLTYEIY